MLVYSVYDAKIEKCLETTQNFSDLDERTCFYLTSKWKQNFAEQNEEKRVYSTRYFYKYKPPMYTVSMVTKTLSSADGMKASNAAWLVIYKLLNDAKTSLQNWQYKL